MNYQIKLILLITASLFFTFKASGQSIESSLTASKTIEVFKHTSHLGVVLKFQTDNLYQVINQPIQIGEIKITPSQPELIAIRLPHNEHQYPELVPSQNTVQLSLHGVNSKKNINLYFHLKGFNFKSAAENENWILSNEKIDNFTTNIFTKSYMHADIYIISLEAAIYTQ